MKARTRFAFEALESRTLLSVVPTLTATPIVATAVPITTVPPVANSGVVLNLVAGVPFTGKVAFYASPVLDPPGAIGGSIDWGDGTTSAATAQYGTDGNTGGYNLIGSHTYTKAGNYTITTTVTIGPLPGSGMEFPTQIVATIKSKAIVAPRHGNSSGGVTIHETASQSFTAVVGNFTTIAPGTGLHAAINWGDGSSSVGVITPTGVVGLDQISFSVSGTHTYALAGRYPIQIVVTRVFPTPVASAINPVIATIDSTAVVRSRISLTGKITGVYSVATPVVSPVSSSAIVPGGSIYQFTGTGTTGDLGDVTAVGTVMLPGPLFPPPPGPVMPDVIVARQATGTLTLSNSKGSVTLSLSGVETATGGFPSTLSFVISAGTGAYAHAKGKGTIGVNLGSMLATAVPIFTLTITSSS